jgi:hypothetical protein
MGGDQPPISGACVGEGYLISWCCFGRVFRANTFPRHWKKTPQISGCPRQHASLLVLDGVVQQIAGQPKSRNSNIFWLFFRNIKTNCE